MFRVKPAPPIRARSRFPHSQTLPSGSFHKPINLLHQRADRMETQLWKPTKLITWITALSNSVKLWAMPCRATQDGWVMVESSDKTWSTGEGNGKPLQYVVHWRKEWQTTSVCSPLEKGISNHFSILALRMPWTVWKGKKTGHWNMPNMLQEKSGEITPERMKRMSQVKTITDGGCDWWWK